MNFRLFLADSAVGTFKKICSSVENLVFVVDDDVVNVSVGVDSAAAATTPFFDLNHEPIARDNRLLEATFIFLFLSTISLC